MRFVCAAGASWIAPPTTVGERGRETAEEEVLQVEAALQALPLAHQGHVEAVTRRLREHGPVVELQEGRAALDIARMLVVMPRLYGDRITDAESIELVARLRARGTPGSLMAAATIGKGAGRDTTMASSEQARDAILLELREWDGLDEHAPSLAGLRNRLSGPQQGRRII